MIPDVAASVGALAPPMACTAGRRRHHLRIHAHPHGARLTCSTPASSCPLTWTARRREARVEGLLWDSAEEVASRALISAQLAAWPMPPTWRQAELPPLPAGFDLDAAVRSAGGR